MKRSTKKGIFITSMMLTIVSLFAFGGKHHGCRNYSNCSNGNSEQSCQRCESSNHHQHATHWWNQNQQPSSENK